MSVSSNFAFLASDNPQLARLGNVAEGYLSQDPNTCLIKLRQFGELLAQQVAAKVGVFASEKEEQLKLLQKLQYKGLMNRQAGQLFHCLRIVGNEATHTLSGDYDTGLKHLKYAYELGVWYHRSFSNCLPIKYPAFVPPVDPATYEEDIQQKVKFESQHRCELEELLKETETKYQEAIASIEQAQTVASMQSPQEIEKTIQTAQKAEAAIPNLMDILTGNLGDEPIIEGYQSINEKLQTVSQAVGQIAHLVGDTSEEYLRLTSGEIILPGIGLASEAKVLEHRSEDLHKGIFKLIVMGEFNHGKSTLLNAMLGSKKLPAKQLATTGIITMLVYGNSDNVAIYETDKEEPRVVTWEHFTEEFQLKREDQQTIANKQPIDRFKNVRYAQIEQPHFLCQSGVRLIDSPGLAENITRTRVTTEFLKQSQAVMFILNASQILSQDEREFIEANFRPGNCDHVFFVVNKINLVEDDDEREDIKSFCREYFKGFFVDEQGAINEELCDRRLFFVNAKAALDARLKQPINEQALEDSGVVDLERELEEFLTSNQRFRAAISSTFDFIISVTEQAHGKIAQRKLTLDEPLVALQQREQEAQQRLDLLQEKITRIELTIKRYIPVIEKRLFISFKDYLNDIKKQWPEDAKNIEALEKLNLLNLAMSIFDDYQKKLICKDINEGIGKYLDKKFEQWSEQIGVVTKSDFDNFKQEIEICVKEFSMELSSIEKMFAQGEEVNVLEDIHENKGDRIAQLIIGLLLGDFSRMAGTVMGDGDWGGFIWESIKQMFLVGGILSIFGGPIEWIILIITEVVMMQTAHDRKKEKLIEKIGDKIFNKLDENLPEIEWRIKEVTAEQFGTFSKHIAQILQEQINQVRSEHEEIIAQRLDTTFSIEKEKERLDKIEKEVLHYFNQISEIAFNRTYTIEEIEWLAKGKLLMNQVKNYATV